MSQNNVVIAISTDYKGFDKTPIKQTAKELQLLNQTIQKVGSQSMSPLQKINAQIQNLKTRMTEMRKEFPSWALSTMFFGMMLKSTFDSIYKSANSTFTDIMSRIEGTVTGTTHLNNSLTYLRFVIGQALEPFNMWLSKIVDRVADLIAENPRLTKFVLVFLGIAGAVLIFVGTIALAIFAINSTVAQFNILYLTLKKLSLVKAFSNLNKSLGLLETKLITAYKEVRNFFVLVFSHPLTWLALAVVAVIAVIMDLSERMGGWGNFFQSVVKSAIMVVGLLVSAFNSLGHAVGNALHWGAWGFIKSIEYMLNDGIDRINKLLSFLGVSTVDNIDITSSWKPTQGLAESFTDGWVKGVEGIEKVLDYVGLNKEFTLEGEAGDGLKNRFNSLKESLGFDLEPPSIPDEDDSSSGDTSYYGDTNITIDLDVPDSQSADAVVEEIYRRIASEQEKIDAFPNL